MADFLAGIVLDAAMHEPLRARFCGRTVSRSCHLAQTFRIDAEKTASVAGRPPTHLREMRSANREQMREDSDKGNVHSGAFSKRRPP